MKRPEQLIQQGVFSFLTPLMFHQKYKNFMAFQIRNETGMDKDQGKIVGGIAKSMGTMAGVTDTVFLFPQTSEERIDFSSPSQGRDGVFYPVRRVNLPPKTVFVEFKAYEELKTKVKAPDEYLSEAQKNFKNRIEIMGYEHRIIVAKDIGDAVNQVRRLLMENSVPA
jgi:hypothetical protein